VSRDPIDLAEGCEIKPEHTLVSSRNPLLFREATLDVIRDVEIQFGRLMKGFERQGILQKSTIILLSDHSAVNHLYTEDFSSTDVMAILEKADLVDDDNVYAFSVSSYGVMYWRDRKRRSCRQGPAPQAQGMEPTEKNGRVPLVGPGSARHGGGDEGRLPAGRAVSQVFCRDGSEKSMIWPDLIVLAKNGWQIPACNGHVPNVGVQAPRGRQVFASTMEGTDPWTPCPLWRPLPCRRKAGRCRLEADPNR